MRSGRGAGSQMKQQATGGPSSTKWWSRGLVGTIAVVAVLAAVLLLGPAIAPQPDQAPTGTESTASATATSLDADIERARQMIASGETTEALVLLRTMKLRQSDPEIDRLIARATETKKPAEGQPQGETAAPLWSGYTTEVADIESLLPAEVAEFVRGYPSTTSGSTLVAYRPQSDTAAAAVVRGVTFEVHDGTSADGARAFVEKTVETSYPTSRGTVRLGAGDADFRTDKRGESVVVFVRGRYAFLVVVSEQPGVAVEELQALSVDLASELPASR